MRRLFSPHNININFKANYTLKNKLTNLKDKVPPIKKSNLVYEITCAEPNCNKKYIGETQQRLQKRVEQHKAAVRRGDAHHSGITEHCLKDLHNFTIENVKVIHQNLKFYKSRKLAEANYIKKTSNNCNRVAGMHLPEIYTSILQ